MFVDTVLIVCRFCYILSYFFLKVNNISIHYFRFTQDNLNELHSIYNNYKKSETFIYSYEAPDIAAVKLSTDSANIWSISPPDRKRMEQEINSSMYRMLYKNRYSNFKCNHSNELFNNTGLVSTSYTKSLVQSVERSTFSIQIRMWSRYMILSFEKSSLILDKYTTRLSNA